jgi:hypoxanthine phosphoribosyltransferase
MRKDGAVKLWDKYFLPFITEEQISSRVTELAKIIGTDYSGKRPLFIAMLNGSFLFASDLLRKLEENCEISFVKYASYQGSESSGELQQLLGLKENVFGRHVILLEDIVDTGLTLSAVFEKLLEEKPLSIRTATLLYKPGKLRYVIRPDYVGFEIGNDFVVGYGMDYNGLGRNFPCLYRLKE